MIQDEFSLHFDFLSRSTTCRVTKRVFRLSFQKSWLVGDSRFILPRCAADPEADCRVTTTTLRVFEIVSLPPRTENIECGRENLILQLNTPVYDVK
jgi:hypothetical protein